MRVVITGGAGFIGSHLCDALLARGDDVVCLDNLITGNLANIEHHFGNDRFRFIQHDVTDYIHVPPPVAMATFPFTLLVMDSHGCHTAIHHQSVPGDKG